MDTYSLKKLTNSAIQEKKIQREHEISETFNSLAPKLKETVENAAKSGLCSVTVHEFKSTANFWCTTPAPADEWESQKYEIAKRFLNYIKAIGLPVKLTRGELWHENTYTWRIVVSWDK